MRDRILPQNNKWIYRLFAMVFLLPMINYYIAAIFWSFSAQNPFAELLFSLTYICGFFSYFLWPQIAKATSVALLGVLLIISFLITPGVVNEIAGPDLLHSQLVTFLLMYFPLFLYSIDKNFQFDIALDYLYYLCIPIVLLCIAAYYCQVFISGMGMEEYMAFAYTGLPAIAIITYMSWKRNNTVVKIISVIGLSTIMFGGCRGALLTVAIFISLCLVFNIKSSKTRIGVLICGLILFLFSNQLLTTVSGLLSSVGYDSRIFYLIEAGEAVESEGREAVFSKAISLINFGGNGLFSDRLLLEKVYDAIYCHNWILEVLVDFGLFFGVPIIAWILYMIIKALMKTLSSMDDVCVFYFIFCITFLAGKYLLSNSYLHSSEIPIILAWLIKISGKKQKFNVA